MSAATTTTTTSSRASALFARPVPGADGRTGPAAADPRTSRARLILCAIALGLAPILLRPREPRLVNTSDNAAKAVTARSPPTGTSSWSATSCSCSGAAALIPGAIALASLVRARGSAWMTTGACMVAVGGGSLAMALWSFTVVGFLGTEKGVARDAAVAIFDHGDNSLL